MTPQINPALLLVVVLATGLAGCGGTSSSDGAAKPAVAAVVERQAENDRRLALLQSYEVGQTTLDTIVADGWLSAVGVALLPNMKDHSDLIRAAANGRRSMATGAKWQELYIQFFKGPLAVRDRYGNRLPGGPTQVCRLDFDQNGVVSKITWFPPYDGG